MGKMKNSNRHGRLSNFVFDAIKFRRHLNTLTEQTTAKLISFFKEKKSIILIQLHRGPESVRNKGS